VPDLGPEIDAGPYDAGWRTEPFDAGPIDALPRQTLLGDWVEVPAGTFLRGSAEDEFGHSGDELQAEVTLTRPFLLKVTEVTQAEWLDVMGDNPTVNPDCGLDCPVDGITWFDALRFTNALSQREGLTPCYAIDGEAVDFVGLDCEGYRLPTEAEWEYACRSGSNLAPLSSGEYLIEHYGPGCREEPATNEVGWYCFNSEEQLKPVGLKPANAWGLRDMHGNAAEWTWDWYHPAYYGLGNSYIDPLGPDRPSLAEARVSRSGTYYTGAPSLRCASRAYAIPQGSGEAQGFRPARTLPTTQ